MSTQPTDLDPLTALQTSYDQLLTQLYSTLSYLSQRHSVIPPTPDPNEPYTRHPLTSTALSQPQSAIVPSAATTDPPQLQSNGTSAPSVPHRARGNENDVIYQPGQEDTSPSFTDRPLLPDPPGLFRDSQHELAEDLILKVGEIHDLIDQLPADADEVGDGEHENAEERDERRIRELSEQVRDVEKERTEKHREVRGLVRRLDRVVLGMRRGLDVNG